MSKKQKLNYSKRPVKIGKRNLNEVLSQVINKNFFKVLLNFFKIHQNPIRAIFNEFFSLGKYPTTIFLKKKILKLKFFQFTIFQLLT